MRVGFIGLGTMGLPMARCLQQAGFDVAGWDEIDSARSAFAASVESLPALVSCDTFVTMLPQAKDVEAVLDSLLQQKLASNCLFIDCSTIDVAATRALAVRLGKAGHSFIDAPVSGGSEGAAQGALSFMVGGEAAATERAKPLLEVLGSKTIAFGAAGSGQAAKACHNMICGITALGVCEAFALADGLDLDLHQFFELCKGAAAQSWILENRCPVPGPAPAAPSSNEYAPGFAARLMAKDLALAQQAATTVGQQTEFGKAAAERFAQYVSDGDGDLDFSAIYSHIRRA